MSAIAHMKHRTTIERNTQTSDTGGGFTDGWNQIASNVRCYIWDLGLVSEAGGSIIGGRPATTSSRAAIMPRTTDIRAGDRIQTVTDRKGKTICEGPLIVDSIGERVDHLYISVRKSV